MYQFGNVLTTQLQAEQEEKYFFEISNFKTQMLHKSNPYSHRSAVFPLSFVLSNIFHESPPIFLPCSPTTTWIKIPELVWLVYILWILA